MSRILQTETYNKYKHYGIMKIELTAVEWNVVFALLDKVNDIMEWDADRQVYTDNDNFVCSMDKEEMKALRRVLKKL